MILRMPVCNQNDLNILLEVSYEELNVNVDPMKMVDLVLDFQLLKVLWIYMTERSGQSVKRIGYIFMC